MLLFNFLICPNFNGILMKKNNKYSLPHKNSYSEAGKAYQHITHLINH